MDKTNLNIKPKGRIILLLGISFLFSFCSTEEPIVQQTLEDYENVWCVIQLEDINEFLFLTEQITEVEEKFVEGFTRQNEIKKLFDDYGNEEKLTASYDLTEEYLITARISFSDFDPAGYTRGSVLDTLNSLVKNEDIPQEVVNFCKTWYKVNDKDI